MGVCDTPPWLFIVRSSSVGAPNRLIFYEFVPCNIKTVLDRSFLKFFLKIPKIFTSTNFSKIDPKGGPFYTKIKKIQKGIFLLQIIFFLPKYEFYMFSAFIWGIKHVCSSKFFNFHFFCQILTIFTNSKGNTVSVSCLRSVIKWTFPFLDFNTFFKNILEQMIPHLKAL